MWGRIGDGNRKNQEAREEELEVGVLKKQEAGEIGVNYATMLKGWLPSKRAKLSKKKRGRRQNSKVREGGGLTSSVGD